MHLVPEIAPELLDFYRTLPSSVLTDSMGRLQVGSWMDDIHGLTPAARVTGRARTLQFARKTGVRHSSHSIYSFAETISPGDVIVIGAHETSGWLFGENIGAFLLRCGIAGVVTDGRIRDREGLSSLPLPLFCRGSTARPFKFDVEVVAVDVPLECAGAYVAPGDLVVGDGDGVAVAPHAAVAALVAEATDIRSLEAAQGQAIRDGKSLKDIRLVADRKSHRTGPEFTAQMRDLTAIR